MKYGLMKYLLFLGVSSIAFFTCACCEEITLELKDIRPLKIEQLLLEKSCSFKSQVQ